MNRYIAKMTVSSFSLLLDLKDIQVGDIVHVLDIDKYYYYSCDKQFVVLEDDIEIEFRETFVLTLYTDIGTFENLELYNTNNIDMESDAIWIAMNKTDYSLIVYKNIISNETVGIRPEIVKAVKAEKKKMR